MPKPTVISNVPIGNGSPLLGLGGVAFQEESYCIRSWTLPRGGSAVFLPCEGGGAHQLVVFVVAGQMAVAGRSIQGPCAVRVGASRRLALAAEADCEAFTIEVPESSLLPAKESSDHVVPTYDKPWFLHEILPNTVVMVAYGVVDAEKSPHGYYNPPHAHRNTEAVLTLSGTGRMGAHHVERGVLVLTPPGVAQDEAIAEGSRLVVKRPMFGPDGQLRWKTNILYGTPAFAEGVARGEIEDVSPAAEM